MGAKRRPMTIADVLAASPPSDFMQRRRVALAFARANEAEARQLIAALAKTEGKSASAIEADRMTILRMIFFPNLASIQASLIAAVVKEHGFTMADINEYRTENT